MGFERITALCRWANREAPRDASAILGGTPTMMSDREVHLLNALARSVVDGRGTIVELGTYLGGSTVAFGHGLRDNPAAVAARIETFDHFRHPANPRFGITAEQDTQPVWEANVAPVRDLVDLHAGDLLGYRRPAAATPIEVLFVDIVKAAPVINAVIGQFYGGLVAGHSVVVHQDYFHWASPWVVYTCEYLRDYLTPYGHVARSSAVFGLQRPIPEELLTKDWTALPLAEQLALMDAAAQRYQATLRGALEVSAVSLLAGHDREAASSRNAELRSRYGENPRLQRYLARQADLLNLSTPSSR